MGGLVTAPIEEGWRLVTGRICVIDDDPDVLAAVGDLMCSAGFAVILHDSADAFLAGGGAAGACCIVCDVNLPGTTGPALLRRLREEGDTTPFVLFTAYPTPLLREQASQLGAGELVEKPFDPDALIDRVAALCQGAGGTGFGAG